MRADSSTFQISICKLEESKIESLLGQLCDRVRVNARQSDEAAVREARRRLSRNSSDEAALHVVAASSLINQQPEKSLALLERTPELLHRDPVANRLAGYAWLAQEKDDLALESFDQSVRLDPCQPDCWAVLGRIAENTGRTEGAIQYYERAIVFENGQDDSALALAKLHERNKNYSDAIHTLRVCLFRNRRSPRLNLALARLLNRRVNVFRRRSMLRAKKKVQLETLSCYQTANAASPSARTYIAQGLLQKQLEMFDDAKVSFEHAIELDNQSLAGYIQLANINVDRGNMREALAQFEHAFSLGRCPATAHFRYTRAKKFKDCPESNVYLGSLQRMLEQENLPSRSQLHLHFAVAKIFDDIKRYDDAWLHYDQANRLNPKHSETESIRRIRRKSVEEKPLQQIAEDSEAFFTPEFFANHQAAGNQSDVPVFIVGIPRSGTTLTEQILSSHRQIAGAGELRLVEQMRRDVRRMFLSSPVSDRSTTYPQMIAGVNEGCLRELADRYLKQLDKHRTDELRVTDKMPTNFVHLGMIATLFPRAKVIYCRRNPMDVLVSGYCQNLSAPFCDLNKIVDYHLNHRRMMAHWQRVLPISIHTVDYEAMVEYPETHSRALVEHCGLEWDERCLDFHNNRRAVHTPSKWQVRQPMYKTSVEKWRRYEQQLQPVAEQLCASV